ncbi:MAG: phosphorylase [Cyanobacteria bacterium P01_F01_bin.150]
MSNVEIPDSSAAGVTKKNSEAICEESFGTDVINSLAIDREENQQYFRQSLWSLAQRQTEHAFQCGALQSIQTSYEFVEHHGVRFLVRILANLARKEKAHKKQQQLKVKGKDFNPFLPYEKDLFVCNLSSTHLCLLNKFNVVDHHLLIVTREFEEQETWLNLHDFSALWSGLREIDGLAFYNGGKVAGASQRHKHIQLVPMPLSPEGWAIPMEAILSQSNGVVNNSYRVLPFRHAFSALNLTPQALPLDAAQILLDCYHRLLDQLNAKKQAEKPAKDQAGQTLGGRDRNFIPYNLLITRRWMLLVPRIQENAYSIPINALGFAGSLFVKNEAQLDLLKKKGPMTLLQTVGDSPRPSV